MDSSKEFLLVFTITALAKVANKMTLHPPVLPASALRMRMGLQLLHVLQTNDHDRGLTFQKYFYDDPQHVLFGFGGCFYIARGKTDLCRGQFEAVLMIKKQCANCRIYTIMNECWRFKPAVRMNTYNAQFFLFSVFWKYLQCLAQDKLVGGRWVEKI